MVLSLPQEIQQPHEIVVRFEPEHDLSPVLGLEPDLDPSSEPLP
jgi:hypothetical protein